MTAEERAVLRALREALELFDKLPRAEKDVVYEPEELVDFGAGIRACRNVVMARDAGRRYLIAEKILADFTVIGG